MTLKEIAKQAGVSPSTVSMVLNCKGSVSESTREKVGKLLAEHGYKVLSAKKEERRRGIRFLKFSNHAHLVQENAGFVSSIMDAVDMETRRLGFNLVMTPFNKSNIAQIKELLQEEPYDGIILLGTELEDEDLAYFTDIKTPLVVVDNAMEKYDFNTVNMNNRESIMKAVDYLYNLGHREIGYLYNKMPSSNCLARKRAYEAALAEYGLKVDPRYIYLVNPTPAMAYNDTFDLLNGGAEYASAFLATNDSIAIGAVRAFKDYGIKIPDEVSIIGFDDILFSEAIDPPLTTLRVPCGDMGAWAVRLLADRMSFPCSPVVKMQLSTTLIPRRSTTAKK